MKKIPAALLLCLLVRIGTRYAEAGLKPGPRARQTLRRIIREIEKDL